MNLNTLFKKAGFLILLLFVMSSVAMAQGLSTVYLDITNGSDAYTGANATNSPAGTGPKATFDGALGAVANNGKIIVKAGTYNGDDAAGGNVLINTASYANLVANGSLTIEVDALGGNTVVDLSAGDFTYDVAGGTLYITSVNGAKLTTAADVYVGAVAASSATVNIDAASTVTVASNQTLYLYGTSTLSGAAPTKGANLNVQYLGTGNVNAGPEAQYGTYGTGVITVNKTNDGDLVTFPATAITAVNGIVVTKGSATFQADVTSQGNVTVAAGGNVNFTNLDMTSDDLIHNGTGTVAVSGTLDFTITDGATAGDLGQISVTAGGTLSVAGLTSWSELISADRDFLANYAVSLADGNITLNGVVLNNNNGAGTNNGADYTFTFYNNDANGSLAVGTVTVNSPAANNQGYGILNVTNQNTGSTSVAGAIRGTATNTTTGTLNLAGATTIGTNLTNVAAGTINVNGATSVAGVLTNNVAGGTIALGTNSLTLSGNSAHLTVNGTVTATTGGIVVSAAGASSFNGGTLSNVTVSGAGTNTISAATNLTNLTISNGAVNMTAPVTGSGNTVVSGGALTLTAVAYVTNNFTQSAGTVTLTAAAGSQLDINGNFTRTAGTFTAGAASDVIFSGTAAQTVAGGPLWTVADLAFTNTAAVVTLDQSVRVTGAATIAAGVDVALNTLNIILFANNASIDNEGTYTASGGGGVIFGGVNTIAGAVANYTGQTITGNGVYSYITIDVGTANAVTMDNAADHVKFNKTLTLRSGDLDIDDGGAGTGTFGPTGTEAKIISYLSGAGAVENVTVTNGGFNTNSPVDYDLEYVGTTTADVTITTGSNEWDADNVKNLTLGFTSNANTVEMILASAGAVTIKGNVTLNAPGAAKFTELQLPAQNVTINGVLTVNKGAEISIGNAANALTLAGDNKAHNVHGTISAVSALVVTGSGSSISGVADAANNENTITDLYFEPAADNATLTVTNLEVIDDIVIQATSVKTGASVDITMNATSGAIATLTVGNATTAPTVNFTAAGTAATHTGVLTLTNGNLTYTRNGAAAATSTIGGAVTLTKGTLTLGSHVYAAAATSQVAANIDAGGYKYVQLGGVNYVRSGAGTFTNGTLSLNSTAGNITLTPGTTFTVPNLESVGTANGVAVGAAMTVSNSLLIDNAATFTQTGVLTVSGPTVTVTSDAGAFAGALTLTNDAATVALDQNYAFPTLVVNSNGTVTVSDNTAKTLTVGTAFTLTKGTLEMGIHNLAVSTAFTRTAGEITQTTGYLVLNVGVPSLGTGFSIDNLEVDGALSVAAAKEKFTVVKNLKLDASVTTFADGDLTFGDGILVHRTDNTATLAKLPTFGANTDLKYSTYTGPADIAIAKEAPASIRNLEVDSDAGAQKVTLASNKTITGTLTLADMLDVTTANPDAVITMADGTTLVLEVDGTSALDANLVKAGSMAIVYDGATNTTPRELGAIASGAHPVINGNVTVKNNVTLDNAKHIFAGTLTFDGGNIIQFAAAQVVNVQGNVVETTNGGFFVPTAAMTLQFNGSTNTTLTLNANRAVNTNLTVEIAKTNKNNTVTLAGGNLDFRHTVESDGNVNKIVLTKGALVTGSNLVILEQDEAVGASPEQGFTRTAGVIAGNVRKYINNAAAQSIDISRVDFPTGSADGNYRPASFFFKTAPQSSFDLTVRHDSVAPGGTNGIPLNTGSVVVTNYPDFYWTATSSQTLAPSYKYDLELQAEGYPDYTLDGIQNVRMIRRAAGSDENFWELQGDDNKYDNQTVTTAWPLVKVIDAEGGITSQGNIFTYSQSDKAPVFDAALANPTTINEGDTLSFTFVASDPDIGQTATMSAVTLPEGATFNAQTGLLTWITDNLDAGTHPVTIRATDGTSNTDTTVSVIVNNVNALPTFTTAPADTVKAAENLATEVQFAATDLDTDNATLTYSIVANVPAPDSVSIVDTTGLVTIIPAFGEEGNVYDLTVRVTDSDGGMTDTTVTVKVTKTNRVPVLTRVTVGDTLEIDEATTGTFVYSASDIDGDNLTYSVMDVAGDTTVTAVMVDSVFTWTPSYTDAGIYSFEVKVMDDGSPAMYAVDTLVVVVNNKNAAPTWVAEMPTDTVYVGDTLSFTYEAADLDMDAITYSFVGNFPSDATLNASTGEFSWAPKTASTFPVLIKVQASDGTASIQTQAEITIEVITVEVAGVVTYENMAMDPIVGADVKLMQGATEVAATTTDSTGAYKFTDVSAGEYSVMVSSSAAWPTSSVLASDALLAARSAVDTNVVLSDMQKLAGDVTGDDVVNAFDALKILQRVVRMISAFDVADWQFESHAAFTVGTSNVNKDFLAIAAGDVNESYTMAGALAKENIAVVEEEALRIAPKAEFELPIKLDAISEVSAFTFRFAYPAEKMELVSVSSKAQGLMSSAQDGVISLAWADLTGNKALVLENEAVVVLKFKATEEFAKSETAGLTLELGEVVNKLGKDVSANISLQGAEVAIPENFALNQNYPNPFNPTTTIAYDMPVAGKVTLKVFNTLGQEVSTLVNEVKEAGSHKAQFNATNMASGIYFFNITVEGTKNFVQTKKMVLLK